MPVIYTVIFGPYDELKEPLVVTPGWEYHVFTDQDLTSKVWKIHKVKSTDSRSSAKLFKILHQFNILNIYIDGSFIINCNLTEFVNRYYKPEKVNLMKHPSRDCVYEEIQACIKLRKERPDILWKAINTLTKEGVKKKQGLPASGIMIRDGSHVKFCEEWYKSLSISMRDQIAWAQADKLHPGSCHLFDYDYSTGTDFLYIPHNNNPKKQKAKLEHYHKEGLI